MIVSAGSLPSNVPDMGEACGGEAGASSSDSSPAESFDQLLSLHGDSELKSSPSKREAQEHGPEADHEKDPSQALQISLAALLQVCVPSPGAPQGGLELAEAPAFEDCVPAGESLKERIGTAIVAAGIQPTGSEFADSAPPPSESAAPQPIGETNADFSQPANSAAPGKVNEISPELLPAISSQAQPLPSAENDLRIFVSPAKADESLVSWQSGAGKKTRGTAGAKAGREMFEASNNHHDSTTGALHARTNPEGFAAVIQSVGDELGGMSEGDAQNGQSAFTSDSNTSNSNDSSMTGSTNSAPLVRSTQGSVAMAPKPVAAAAIVEQLNQGLERIQQMGSNRLELRLSLEGHGAVNIDLQVRDGAVHASIATGSEELREALKQGWSQLAGRSESLGMPLRDPVFTKLVTPGSALESASQKDFQEHRQREHRQEQSASPVPYLPSQQTRRAATSAPPAHTSTSSPIAWA